MAIDQHYIPAFSIEDVILDKDTGAPLSGGLVYFEQDNNRGVLKPVYQITGTSPDYTYTQLPNPMTLSSIGTFEDSLANPVIPYFFPYDGDLQPEYYYVRVTSSEDVEQFTREAVPYIPDATSINTISSAFGNQLSNPQFAEVLFDTTTVSSYTYNFSAASGEEVTIAPGWDIVVTSAGAGTVTVTQVTPLGTTNDPTNPGTILRISSTGLTELLLRQRIYGSPNLWGNGYISASFVAKNNSGTATTLTLDYDQSNGLAVDQRIITATLPANGTFAAYPGTKLIRTSTSNQDFPDAYIDIYFTIPLSIEIEITSVMLAFTGSVGVDTIVYDQDSQDRQIDHLFHYYKPQLDFKPIPSLLTGWDFSLNPAQFASTTVTVTAGTPKYVWDQLIMNSIGGNVQITADATTQGLRVLYNSANSAFYCLQYLTGYQAKKILGTTLSVNIQAWHNPNLDTVTTRAYLFRGSSAAVIPTIPNTIGSIATSGIFTKNATAGQGADWTEIARGNLGTATATLKEVNLTSGLEEINDGVDYGFNGWEITDHAEIANTDKFCIITTFAATKASSVVIIPSISCVPGDIPTRPAPQTVDQVFRECQYYWQSSFLPGATVPPRAETTGIKSAPMTSYWNGAIASEIFPQTFSHDYPVTMRIAPTVSLYSGTTTTASRVQGFAVFGTAVTAEKVLGTFWSVVVTNTNGFEVVGAISGGPLFGSSLSAGASPGYIQYHHISEGRLGIV